MHSVYLTTLLTILAASTVVSGLPSHTRTASRLSPITMQNNRIIEESKQAFLPPIGPQIVCVMAPCGASERARWYNRLPGSGKRAIEPTETRPHSSLDDKIASVTEMVSQLSAAQDSDNDVAVEDTKHAFFLNLCPIRCILGPCCGSKYKRDLEAIASHPHLSLDDKHARVRTMNEELQRIEDEKKAFIHDILSLRTTTIAPLSFTRTNQRREAVDLEDKHAIFCNHITGSGCGGGSSKFRPLIQEILYKRDNMPNAKLPNTWDPLLPTIMKYAAGKRAIQQRSVDLEDKLAVLCNLYTGGGCGGAGELPGLFGGLVYKRDTLPNEKWRSTMPVFSVEQSFGSGGLI
ncbi:hypothetical protein BJ508DRAFT_364046 [Ascobolus immersus RN42]|uniref:Uncharacterized protein n=1 Tax=Ascobolus immersus RN42 TaxID=1160509 RepID=A0A3N4HW40_ASCIM|nr:hypothetical protein BJ508DRAFT_364046 [Ascobolus immersus RN42]